VLRISYERTLLGQDKREFFTVKFYGASWREASVDALSRESTTSIVTVSSASAAHSEVV
jgi:hypothetical protein